jgi:aspartate-semialdehyde dehydrogenase
VFFTTSNVGGQGPAIGKEIAPLKDAYSIEELKGLDVILTCQGGDYTNEVFPKLREAGWQGYWIDAASSLRMDDSSVIVLDPVNRKVIDQQLDAGTKNYIGGNCTVSHADGPGRPLRSRSGRVDECHDLSGGIRCRRAEHARADQADGRDQCLGGR